MEHAPTTLRALLFPVDGRVEPLEIDPLHVLADLYRAMQCSLVDVVVLDHGIDLWCDDEALLVEQPRANRAWLVRRCSHAYAQPLVGHVVALGRTDDGEARSLTIDEAELVMDRVIGVSPALATAGDLRPDRAALARWLVDGVDWRN